MLQKLKQEHSESADLREGSGYDIQNLIRTSLSEGEDPVSFSPDR